MPGVITMQMLGSRGRTGNAFFQYAFLRGYAQAIGADIQTPDWWGRKVFPLAASDPLIDRDLPPTMCDSLTSQRGVPMTYFFGRTDIDLVGYYQHQQFIDFYTRKQVRDWFKLRCELDFYSPRDSGCTAGGGYSAKHLRRGDYETPPFNKLYATVSDESYDKAVKQFNIPAPIIPVFDGSFLPTQHLVDLGVPWLYDWLTLRDADHLLRANSSFSWWAGACGHGKVYSPVVDNLVGPQTVPFVEGNHPNLAGIFPNQSQLFLKEE